MQQKSEIHDDARPHAAADWLVRLDAGDADGATREAFLAWLESSPENESDYEICEAIMAVAANLARDDEIASGCDRIAPLVPSREMLAHGRTAMRWILRPGLSMALAVFAIAGVVLGPLSLIGEAPRESEVRAPGQSADSRTGAPEQLGQAPAQSEGAVTPVQDRSPQQRAEAESDPGAESVAPDQANASDCGSNRLPDDRIGAVEQEIRAAKLELERLRQTYTDRHPSVVERTRHLSELETQLSTLRAPQPSETLSALLDCIAAGGQAPVDEARQ